MNRSSRALYGLSGSMATAPTSYVDIISTFLGRYPKQPLRAFWDALLETEAHDGPEIPIAILTVVNCGIENRTTDDIGQLQNKLGYILNSGATPLILAAHANRADVVEALINLAADPTVNDGNALSLTTALHGAAQNGNVEAINAIYLSENA